jgi:fucose permease
VASIYLIAARGRLLEVSPSCFPQVLYASPLDLSHMTRILGWVVEYLVAHRNGALDKVGYVPTGFWAGLFLGRLLLAEPTHRFGEQRSIMCLGIVCLMFHLLFWLVPNLVASAVAFSFMGFFFGPFFATGMSVASRIFPRKIQSTALGEYYCGIWSRP